MTRTLIHVDETKIMQEYHLQSHLLAKLITASKLDDSKIKDLLLVDTEIKTSQAECIKACAERILECKENKQKIFVGGDYDADGICATAIMKDVLDRLGIENGYYIPDRFKEGYGLHPNTVALAKEKGYAMIITVDNGVKAFSAIDKARELDIPIIITDHHQIDEEIKADLIVHPNYMEDEFSYLSGAGVAWQISRYLLGEVPSHTALAAIAAIGDVMPLWNQTRVLVKRGILDLRAGALPSVLPLFYKKDNINETSIAWQIVPKLNSVGRLNDESNVNTVVRFLLSENQNTIEHYSAQLNKVNERRKKLSTTMAKQAESLCQNHKIDIIFDSTFHEGICGLVAGKLANANHKPTLVFAKSEEKIKGSGRSIPGFNLFEFFQEGFPEMIAFGGHEQAVGIAVKEEDFESFSRRVHEKAKEKEVVFQEKETFAIKVDSAFVSSEEVDALELLLPLPKELSHFNFAIENLKQTNKIVTEKFVKYKFKNEFGDFDAIAFAKSGLDPIDYPSYVIGTLSFNYWRNMKNIQLEIEDIIE